MPPTDVLTAELSVMDIIKMFRMLVNSKSSHTGNIRGTGFRKIKVLTDPSPCHLGYFFYWKIPLKINSRQIVYLFILKRFPNCCNFCCWCYWRLLGYCGCGWQWWVVQSHFLVTSNAELRLCCADMQKDYFYPAKKMSGQFVWKILWIESY